ncbi:Glutamyl-tRNA reductase-binding protein, chloroplastic [Vitis vinifera]|uniref:Glutamyl-tRNA reductase-binding protein, chloroplastic n=1 Tax=Vitis vinifera TaxID=29760 RepID=A0A438HY83_VITVI|nr:Glutamyl-tRNA reductase-binding protein, chloroplastic [Vitis vinifera]
MEDLLHLNLVNKYTLQLISIIIHISRLPFSLGCSNIFFLQKLHSIWERRFEEEVDENLLHVVSVERVLQMEDFQEVGTWVTSSDYKTANPDPLRDCAEKFVDEINTNNMEDVHRFCNIYVDLDFQVWTQHKFYYVVNDCLCNKETEFLIVPEEDMFLTGCHFLWQASEAKLIWVDRLGFDMRISSPQQDVFEVRIPFPREVTDEKGAKSSFNSMSQLAWEVEKNYNAPDFKKVKQLKQIAYRGQ